MNTLPILLNCFNKPATLLNCSILFWCRSFDYACDIVELFQQNGDIVEMFQQHGDTVDLFKKMVILLNCFNNMVILLDSFNNTEIFVNYLTTLVITGLLNCRGEIVE